jgi:hypothetical protein
VLTSPTTGNVPVYNGSKWVNGALGAGADIAISTASPPVISVDIPSGTSWPGSPSTGQLYVRTDLNVIGYYTGSAWLVSPMGSTSRPPDIIQMTSVIPGVTSLTTTLTPNQTVQTTSHLYAIAVNLNSAFSTPTGYSLLSTATSGNNVQVAVYKRESPTGTSADNCTLTQASTGAIGGYLIEVANAGAATGYSGATVSSSEQWWSPTISASINMLLVAVFMPDSSQSPSNIEGTFGWTVYPPSAGSSTGAAPTMQIKIATTASTQVAYWMASSAAKGVVAIFGIPSAG